MLALITLSGGAWIFLAVICVWLVATAWGLYSRTGSAINQRSYHSAYLGQPGAHIDSVMTHDRVAARQLTRGTRP
jgi:hypothetical protein